MPNISVKPNRASVKRNAADNVERICGIPHAEPRQAVFGEVPLPFAPQITLEDGRSAVPQQYLKVQRSVENIEDIVEHIEFCENYLVFVGEENGVMSLQVGVIGEENYPQNPQQAYQTKIVYGRRWLIEPSAPTSEIVQTAMLAIKKAREHELREKVTLRINDGANITTPFNNHMDLPLMAGNSAFFDRRDQAQASDIEPEIHTLLSSIRVASLGLRLNTLHLLGDKRALLELDTFLIEQDDDFFPELTEQTLSFICDDLSPSGVLHELMSELLKRSDRYIEENFRFKGFARFSRDLCPQRIAEFSYNTRSIKSQDARFNGYFREMSYEVDAAKAPDYANGELGSKQRAAILQKGVSAGHLPGESVVVDRKQLDRS